MSALQLRNRGRRLPCAAVIAVVFLALVAAPVTVGAAEPPGVTPTNATTELGGVVAFDVTTGGETSVEVTIRADDGSYARNLTVWDADGDGRIRLRLNTHVANRTGTASRAYSTTDAEPVTVTDARGGALGPGTYTLQAVVDGESTGDATFTVTERSVENATILTAPERTTDRLTTREAIATARDEGRLAPTDVVAKGDALVVRFESDGLAGALAAQDAGTPTAQFRSLLEEGGTRLHFYETNPSPMRDSKAIAVNGTGVGRVVADRENGTYYVFVDRDAAPVGSLDYPDGFSEPRYTREIDDGDVWATRFTVGGERVVDGKRADAVKWDGPVAPMNFETVHSSVGIGLPDGSERHLFAPEPNQPVAVRTTLAPGTVVTLNATTPDGEHVATDRFVVQQADGNEYNVARTTLDLSDVDAEQVTLTARARNATTTTTLRPVVDPALLRIEEGANTSDGRVAVHDVTVPRGGYVAIYRGSDADVSRQHQFLGYSDYLEPGKHDTVPVEVSDANATAALTAALYYSEDDSFLPGSDRPYLVNGIPVTDSQSPPTETPIETTSASTSTATATTESGTDATGVGLTAATALVGLIACGLLAHRSW